MPSSALSNRIRKMPPARHHQDSVRRVIASGKVIRGGQMHWETELLHDGGTGRTFGFGASLSFSSPGAAVLFFLKEEKEKNGGAKKTGRPMAAHIL